MVDDSRRVSRCEQAIPVHVQKRWRRLHQLQKTFAEKIIAEQFLGKPQVENVPDTRWRSQLGVKEVDLETAKIRMDVLKSGWPFTDQPPPLKEEYQLENPGPIQKLALKFWKEEITWEQMHVQAAEYYTREKQWEKAEREYRALIQATPMNPSPYLFLGRLLMYQGKLDEALSVLQQAIRFEAEPAALKMIGSAYLLRSEGGKAAVYLERALKAMPGDGQLFVQLAQAYALQGEFAKANQYIRQALSSGTSNPEAQQLAEYIKQQLQQPPPEKRR